MENNIKWLCEQEPWVRYRTRIDLLGYSINNHEVKKDYEELINHQSKSNEKGLYTPESIYRAWKDWDFGQKKVSSGWITFLVSRIINRI